MEVMNLCENLWGEEWSKKCGKSINMEGGCVWENVNVFLGLKIFDICVCFCVKMGEKTITIMNRSEYKEKWNYKIDTAFGNEIFGFSCAW